MAGSGIADFERFFLLLVVGKGLILRKVSFKMKHLTGRVCRLDRYASEESSNEA
jgi:hypothetical protein